MGQSGRPLGGLRGRTEEANELALWLRAITAGVPVRVLAETFHCSRTAWSEYRSGAKLIPEKLLDQVVKRFVPEEERKRKHDEGRRLLRNAQAAVPQQASRSDTLDRSGPTDRPSMPAGVADVLLRLDDARLQQIEAMRKLADSEKRSSQLQEMVSVLQNQCAQLTDERDRARLEAGSVQELQAALEQSETYRLQAEGQLRHARKASEEAFELRLVAEAKVARAQAEARRTTGGAQGAGGRLPQPAGVGLDLPPLERIGEVLQAVSDQLAEQDAELNELRSHLGVAEPVSPQPGAPVVITGQVVARHDERAEGGAVVRRDGADNADNPATSTDTAWSSPSNPLVQALSAAVSATDLGRALELLRVRAGVGEWPVARMAECANRGRPQFEDLYTESAVGGWLDGSSFPRNYWPLEALVAAMGATYEEKAAFRQSYMDIWPQKAAAFRAEQEQARQKENRAQEARAKAARERREREEAQQAGRARAAREEAAREQGEREEAQQAAQARAAREEAERQWARRKWNAQQEAVVARRREAEEDARAQWSVVFIGQIEQVSDVRGLARMLQELDGRTWITHEQIAQAVFGSTKREHVETVGQWMSGSAMPTDRHFTLLLQALEAWPGEVAALQQARSRVLFDEHVWSTAHPVLPGPAAPAGPADVSSPPVQAAPDAARAPGRPTTTTPPGETAPTVAPAPMREAGEADRGGPPAGKPGWGWYAIRLGAWAAMATVWAAGTTAVRTDPQAPLQPLFTYGLIALALSVGLWFVWLAPPTPRPRKRTAAHFFITYGPQSALAAGVIIPWLPHTDIWARWLADLAGLL
ncbi:hypothetical protein ACF064_35580 [Streptomyces sp. NPDC015492]|uniref:hypothetical protein n=1 Tax=Streptomyces sp. NPDC015492 TaxID=3364958 RepID=UPI0036FB4D92